MQEPVRKGVTRLIAGYAAIAFSLPYLALKIAWISVAPVGMLDKSLVAEPSMLALNILSFCMDAVASLVSVEPGLDRIRRHVLLGLLALNGRCVAVLPRRYLMAAHCQ